MGKGLALECAKRFQYVEVAYQHMCADNRFHPGDVHTLNADKWRWVALAATQDDWRKPSDLGWIESICLEFVLTSTGWGDGIAVPKLGCGLGGLDWEAAVKPVMEHYFGKTGFVAEIYQ